MQISIEKVYLAISGSLFYSNAVGYYSGSWYQDRILKIPAYSNNILTTFGFKEEADIQIELLDTDLSITNAIKNSNREGTITFTLKSYGNSNFFDKYTRNVQIVQITKHRGICVIVLKNRDIQSLKKKFPDVYLAKEYVTGGITAATSLSSLYTEFVGKLAGMCYGQYNSKIEFIPIGEVSSSLGAYTNSFCPGSTAATNITSYELTGSSRYGFHRFIGPELLYNSSSINTYISNSIRNYINYTGYISSSNTATFLTNLQTILPAVYRGDRYVIPVFNYTGNADEYTPEYLPNIQNYNVDGNGIKPYLCIDFPREQVDFNNKFYKITADISVDSNTEAERTPSRIIYRMMQRAGLACNTAAFDALTYFETSSQIYCNYNFSGNLLMRDHILAVAKVARASIYQRYDGLWTIKSEAIRNYYDELTNTFSTALTLYIPFNNYGIDNGIVNLSASAYLPSQIDGGEYTHNEYFEYGVTNPKGLLALNNAQLGSSTHLHMAFNIIVNTASGAVGNTFSLFSLYLDSTKPNSAAITFGAFVSSSGYPEAYVQYGTGTAARFNDVRLSTFQDNKINVVLGFQDAVVNSGEMYYNSSVISTGISYTANSIEFTYNDAYIVFNTYSSISYTINDMVFFSTVSAAKLAVPYRYSVLDRSVCDFLNEDYGDPVDVGTMTYPQLPEKILVKYGKSDAGGDEDNPRYTFQYTSSIGEVQDTYTFPEVYTYKTGNILFSYIRRKVLNKVLLDFTSPRRYTPGNIVYINSSDFAINKPYNIISYNYENGVYTYNAYEYSSSNYTVDTVTNYPEWATTYKIDFSNTPPLAPLTLSFIAGGWDSDRKQAYVTWECELQEGQEVDGELFMYAECFDTFKQYYAIGIEKEDTTSWVFDSNKIIKSDNFYTYDLPAGHVYNNYENISNFDPVSYPYSGSQTEDKTAMYHLVRNDVAGVSPGISQARSEFTKIFGIDGIYKYVKPAFINTDGIAGKVHPFQGTLCDIRENNTYLVALLYSAPEAYSRTGTNDSNTATIRVGFQLMNSGLNDYIQVDGTVGTNETFLSQGATTHSFTYSTLYSFHNSASFSHYYLLYARIIKDGSTDSLGYLGAGPEYGYIPTYKISSDTKWIHAVAVTTATSSTWNTQVDLALLKSFVAIVDPKLNTSLPEPLGRTLQYMDGGPASKYEGVKYRKTFYLPPYSGYTVKAYIQNKNKIDGLPVKTNIVLGNSNNYGYKSYEQVTPGPWREV